MKIKFALLALLLGVCVSASAQIYKEDYIINKDNSLKEPKVNMIYGLMAGVNVPVMSDKNDVVEIDNTAGYQLGMMWGVDMGALEIVPEIWYQHNKSNIYHSTYKEEGHLISNGIEVPIIFAMSFGDIVRLNLGPSFSLMSDAKYRSVDGDEEEDFGRYKSTAGYVVGVSVTLSKRFIFDARYSGRFVSTESTWHSASSEHDYRFYSYSFNLGYRF